MFSGVHVPTAVAIAVVCVVAVVPLLIAVSTVRRRRERRLIEETLGQSYEPDRSKRSPGALDEDPLAVVAKKRAAALGRSRRPWS